MFFKSAEDPPKGLIRSDDVCHYALFGTGDLEVDFTMEVNCGGFKDTRSYFTDYDFVQVDGWNVDGLLCLPCDKYGVKFPDVKRMTERYKADMQRTAKLPSVQPTVNHIKTAL